MLCRLFILFPVMLALCLLPGLRPAMALPSADVCEWAAQQAAQESGVPVDILGALTLTETGRRRTPYRRDRAPMTDRRRRVGPVPSSRIERRPEEMTWPK